MTVGYLEKIRPAGNFDPDSNGYDYQSIADSGDNITDTLQHIDNRTGMVLIGRNRPEWDDMVAAEAEWGHHVVKADSGRYYSVRMPNYLAKIKPVNSDDDTQENFSERARKDYNFALENNVEFGFGDAVRRGLATETGLMKQIPIAGGWIGFAENTLMTQAAKRLYGGFDYSKSVSKAPPGKEDIGVHRPVFFDKAADEKLVGAYLKYIAADKTALARIAEGVIGLPRWFAEFAATGGLASLGDDFARKMGEKVLGHYAKSAAGKVALRTAGWSAGAFTRSFGLSSTIGEKYTEQMVNEVLGLKEETGWGTKLARAWGDVYIEALSESLFGEIGTGALLDEKLILKGLKKMPLGQKFIPALEDAWKKATSGTKAQFIKKMNSKGGYSNILGEVGEERLGTTLRAIANVDDFGLGKDSTWMERLKAGWVQDAENIFVELGVLSFPTAAHVAGGKILNRPKMDRIRTELGAKADDIAMWEAQAQEIRDALDSEVEGKTQEEVAEPPTEAPPETATEETETADETQAEEAEAPKTEAVRERTREVEVNPTRIEHADKAAEVDNVVGQLMTDRADPSKTSLRHEDIQKGRALLGLDGVPSDARKGQLQDLQAAKDGGYVLEAEANAAAALAGEKVLTRVERAGLLIRLAQFTAQYESKKALLAKATEPLAITSLSTEMERIQSRYDSVSLAAHRAGSEAGRGLVFQKMLIPIDENYDYLSVSSRLKAKRGKEPTVKQAEKLKKLTDELEQKDREIERLRKEVSEMMANNFLEKGKVARYKEMNSAEVLSERGSLISKITHLLDEGC